MTDSTDTTDPDSTRVDLGEDLLHVETREVSITRTPDNQDLLESARILMNESFTEEAKKVLRKIILSDPHHLVARQRLAEIHELELKQIFGTEAPRGRAAKPYERFFPHSDDLMRDLDKDLKLDLLSDAGSEKSLVASIFGETGALKAFSARIESQIDGVDARERIDVGIAFLEIGLYEVALKLFQQAAAEENVTEENSLQKLPAIALQAYTQILAGKAFEATLLLHTWVRDPEIEALKKIEFFYLLGRAYESMDNSAEAKQWYAKTQELDLFYRDAAERSSRL